MISSSLGVLRCVSLKFFVGYNAYVAIMKFVADTMLGNLARWLRILGYDTLYSSSFEDWRLLRVAEEEKRILLTKDESLFRRARTRGLSALLITSDDIAEMLAYVAAKTGAELSFNPSRTRCPECNTLLMKISKAEALSLLGGELITKYDEFWRCGKCGKIYWQGNHWRTINSILEKANKLIINFSSKF
ncbi:MAG: Mut7-C RNAse domain-containing protein [Desulfurococcaceae archaeon]|nr:Mut7-C RNAse domain-containing protein [Desulfurococcaceae archaeon]